MNLENCRKELLAQGVETEEITVIKNGVECRGIRIIDSNGGTVSPVVYYSEEDTIEEFENRISSALSVNMPINVDLVRDWNYIRKNLYISIQRRSEEKIVKKQYLNLDLTMRVYFDINGSTGTAKVTPALIEATGVAEEVFWKTAIANSRSKYHIVSLAQMFDIDDVKDNGMYVVIADDLIDGASSLFYASIFEDFCRDHREESCYILPSSREEVIVMPESMVIEGGIDVAELAGLVRTINAEQVDPIIQLEAVVYAYRLADGEIEIVARS